MERQLSILQVEDPLQKFLATALSSQQQQDENGHLAGGNPGKQSSSRTSSSNQSESSSISPKRSAAKERDASSDPPPVKRSPGRPPGSPNKVIFAKIVAKQKLCIFWFRHHYFTLVCTVQVKKDFELHLLVQKSLFDTCAHCAGEKGQDSVSAIGSSSGNDFERVCLRVRLLLCVGERAQHSPQVAKVQKYKNWWFSANKWFRPTPKTSLVIISIYSLHCAARPRETAGSDFICEFNFLLLFTQTILVKDQLFTTHKRHALTNIHISSTHMMRNLYWRWFWRRMWIYQHIGAGPQHPSRVRKY